MVVVASHISGQRKTWCINKLSTGEEILEALKQREGHASDVVLQCHGRVVCPSTLVDDTAVVVATLRLPGGKGGFGSMLRAIGAQIEKTTNREACRDLSGRRLRDINEEKRLKDFISKKADRERELQEKKRQKFKMLQESPRHTFEDEVYFQQRELREKNLYDSLDKAFGSKDSDSSDATRRLKEKSVTQSKKKRFIDNLDDSSSEDENNGEEVETRPQEATDNSTSITISDSNSNSSNGSTTEKEKDQKANVQSIAFKFKKDIGSSCVKRHLKEESVAPIKKGRVMD